MAWLGTASALALPVREKKMAQFLEIESKKEIFFFTFGVGAGVGFGMESHLTSQIDPHLFDTGLFAFMFS